MSKTNNRCPPSFDELRKEKSANEILSNVKAFTVRIKGGFFNRSNMERQYKLKEWQRLRLRADTENEKDPFAIKIVCEENSEEYWFIPAELASRIYGMDDYIVTVYEGITKEDTIWSTRKFWAILLFEKNI